MYRSIVEAPANARKEAKARQKDQQVFSLTSRPGDGCGILSGARSGSSSRSRSLSIGSSNYSCSCGFAGSGDRFSWTHTMMEHFSNFSFFMFCITIYVRTYVRKQQTTVTGNRS
jgi:hypothetical protein